MICEVNSRQEHLTPQAQDHDAAKTGALEAMGWRVHPVTVGLLKSTTSREALFGQIARSLWDARHPAIRPKRSDGGET